MSKITDNELKETFEILYRNANALNKLRIKRAVAEFDPESPDPPVMKGIDLEYIKKNLKE